MNTVLKLFTSLLRNVGQTWVESNGCLGDTQNGFRPGGDIFDNLCDYMATLEHAKSMSQNIYVAYMDFKSAFNGM